jgi:cell division protein FtsA
MARDSLVAGIDIGTSKITTLIATVPDEGSLHVIGVSTIDSKGLRKGQVVNIEEATDAISRSLEAAERMAGTEVAQAFLTIGGNHITSINSHGVVAVAEPDREITHQDVNRVIDAAKAISLPSSREILHVLPRSYTVDAQDGIVDPVGMTGVRLEVDTHLVTAGATAVRNLHKCVEELGIDVSGMVFGGLASATSCITSTEKELGVVVVDIGGGTTDIAIFIEGALAHSAVIPIGAINITKDLAAGLRVSLESAEKIKLELGRLARMHGVEEEKKEKNEHDDLDLRSLELSEEIGKISRKTLVEGIIKPRLNEMFTMIGMEIKRSGFTSQIPSGIVLTGGGAETVGAIAAAKRNLGLPVHTGFPRGVDGFVEEISTPAFAASVGLLLYGASLGKTQGRMKIGDMSKFGNKLPIKGVAGKIIDLVRSFLP